MGRKRLSDAIPKRFERLTAEEKVTLDATLMEGFVNRFLLSRYDNPHPTPPFHREMWKMWASESKYVGAAAPRDHAKTTAGTQAVALASVLFGFRDHVLIVGGSEALSSSLLKDIRVELTENDELIDTFEVHGLTKDNDTELIGAVGKRIFRIIARGGGQRLRGTKWRNRRPNLILVDDLEDDEEVLSLERREKLRKWFLNALLKIGSDNALFRMAGTILHEDSLLNRLLHDSMWLTKRWSAHRAFDDFSDILWPEKYPEERLRAERQLFINQHNASGYSMEMLNLPVAEGEHYFRQDRFVGMRSGVRQVGRAPELNDFISPKHYYAGVDLAISKADRANKTSIVVGGLDAEDMLNVVHRRAGRWDADEIVENLLEVQQLFELEAMAIEKGHISMTLGPSLERRMRETGVFIDLMSVTPTKDKPSRCRSFQQRHNAGGVRYDKEAGWFEEMKAQMDQFTNRGSLSGADDDVDALGLLGLVCNKMVPALTREELEESALEAMELLQRLAEQGRSDVTGY